MHTPEALAKHYISYNAKVGEVISLLLLSMKKENDKVTLPLHYVKKNPSLNRKTMHFLPLSGVWICIFIGKNFGKFMVYELKY